MEAKLYEALETFEFRGVQRKKGDTFRITEEKAEGLGEKVKLAGNQEGAETPAPKAPAPEGEGTPETAPAEGTPEGEPSTPPETAPVSKYTVKEAFELDGVNQEIDSVIELSEEKAAELGEKIEKVEATE